MLPLSYPNRWRIAGIALLLIVLGSTLAPEFGPWRYRGSELLNDKWAHGITFALLAIWSTGHYGRHSYWRLVGGLLVFGAFIEVCQSLLTYRTAETADFAADALGVLAGMLIAMAGLGGWSLRFESWVRRFG